MSFVPPFYSKFGKNVKDLHKKKYDFDHSLKTIHRTKDVTIENGVTQFSSGDLKGYTKFNFSNLTNKGVVEGELHTDAGSESKATFRFTKPYPGVNLAFNLHSALKGKDKVSAPAASVEADYVREYFSAGLTARTDFDTHKVDANAAVGADGISVGAQVVVNAKKADAASNSTQFAGHELKFESNFGAEYSQSDFSSSVWTDRSARYVSAGYFQKLSSTHQLGAVFKYDTHGKDARQLVAGTDYRIDADTSVKAKIDLPTGVVSTSLEHRLANPKLLLQLAAEFNAPKKSADKFGVNVTFGDF